MGGACCHDFRGFCCCLELLLESAEAAVEPKQILEQRLPPPGQRGFPSPGKAKTPLGCPSTPQPQVLSQDLSMSLGLQTEAKPRPLPPPSVGHNFVWVTFLTTSPQTVDHRPATNQTTLPRRLESNLA